MKRTIWIFALLLTTFAATARSEFSIGGGAHYWRTLEEIADDDEFDDDGLAYMASIQIVPARLLRIEADVEIFPDGFAGSTDTAYAPQGYLILGSALYAGLGVGTVYSSDFEDDFSDPFYVVRAGLNLELLPGLYLDLNANYHFVEWEEIEDVDDDADGDTITLGAMLRVVL